MKKILKMFSAAVVMAAFAVVFAACDTGTQTTTPAALTSTTEYIPITPLNASVDNFADLQSAIASGGTQTITITQDISMTAQITVPIDANITLITNNSSGVSLTWNGTNDAPRHFSVQHGGTLNLGISSGTAVQNNITIAGRAPQGGGGIVMQSLGNLIAVFNMNGGEIRDINRTLAAFDGSGVSVNGGTFNMIGGTITNNSTTGVGGGVHIFNGGSFIMNGGNIANNTASSGENVNVLNGTFTHNSGTIANGIPTITSGTTSNHTAGTVFTSATPTATSSVSPITWVADSGSLPSGVTLNANTGVVTGTAASTAGTFTIRARTPVGDSVDAITVTVAATSTTPPPVSPPPPSVGAA
ncbi:MAG: hypothetical protein FWB82_05620, partial [Treponema sp.]|nr:hypothetical protein [Treponema sp.]